jgi:hypothetical protein
MIDIENKVTNTCAKAIVDNLNTNSFLGALVPSSALDTDAAGDFKIVASLVGGDAKKKLI